jgi:hypothetical protein
MNERIQKLAKRAYEDVIADTPSFLVTKEMYEQKFAELIVRECMEVVTKKCASPTAYNALAEHFGVEECTFLNAI